jgi:peptidyl-prolyl cis-trans isomerase SurA
MRFKTQVAVVVAGLALSLPAGSQTVATLPMKAAPPAYASPMEKPLARVNGTVLTERDLQRTLHAIFPYTQQHGGVPKGMEAEMRKGALDMVIFDELVYQEARRRNLQVPAAKLNRAMAKFRGEFSSEKEYRQFLVVETEGSELIAKEKIRRSLLIESFMKREVLGKAAVTPAQAQAYYRANPKQFELPERASLQTISIIPPPNASPAVEKEARGKAEDAHRRARATRSYREFGLLAEKISDDDWRVNMGDRKWTETEKLPPPVVEAIRKMKPGEVSGLLQFGPNYTMFRLNAYTPPGRESFAAAKSKLMADLQKAKYERLRADLHKALRKSANVEVW